ncbi:MAG: ChaN family lipoprotein [Methyloligellaceae bacterium]
MTHAFMRFCSAALILWGAIWLPTNLSAQTKLPIKTWTSELHRDHPLTGRIWSTKQNTYLTPLDLAEALALNDFILLGEIHDNPDHHRLQAWLISSIALYDRRPAIIWEMISLDQSSALEVYTNPYEAPMAGLGGAIQWSTRGWPDWEIYLPIAETAFRYKLRMFPGDVSREEMQLVRDKGFQGLETERRKSLGISQNLERGLMKDLQTALYESHCRMIPQKATAKMASIQRLRDAVMAEQMITTGNRTGAVLIAGAGHTRQDRGVPWYLRQRLPDATIASLTMVEVTGTMTEAKDHVPESSSGKAAADYVWFTARTKREDPCLAFQKKK